VTYSYDDVFLVEEKLELKWWCVFGWRKTRTQIWKVGIRM